MLKLAVISIIICCSCQTIDHRTDMPVPKIEESTCPQLDSFLVELGFSFSAESVELKNSINPLLDSFLTNVDIDCLREQRNYKTFITIILTKLALYHLRCCNQGYDLYQMDGESAKRVINEFELFSGFRTESPEILTSGTIYDYIKADTVLNKHPYIDSLVREIDKEKSRIKKGIF